MLLVIQRRLLMIALLAVLLTQQACATLRADGWTGDNRARLQQMIERYGKSSSSYDAERPPVAVFDWDNTVIKNDIGDATFFALLEQEKILQPPNYDWHQTSRYLSDDAVAALEQACGREVAPGMPLPTRSNQDCANEIKQLYLKFETRTHLAGFVARPYDPRHMVPAWAWAAQLEMGHTSQEMTHFAEQVIETQLRAEMADGQEYIRVYAPMRELVQVLQEHGFAVWILSASPQIMVQTFAARLGIPQERVIGIRTLLDSNQRLTSQLVGCGPFGDAEERIITYRDGKRCFMNQEIFGIQGAAALKIQNDLRNRPVFAAGDADTDASFVADAVGLHLVIDRQKPELVCQAYANPDGNWLINPMFIKPMDKATQPLMCSKMGESP